MSDKSFIQGVRYAEDCCLLPSLLTLVDVTASESLWVLLRSIAACTSHFLRFEIYKKSCLENTIQNGGILCDAMDE